MDNHKSYKNRNGIVNDLSDLDEESYESVEGKSKKKRKAVSEYKQAISSIGSKSTTCSSISSFGKKIINKVIISESDYNMNDRWLINDMPKPTTTNNKRKHSVNIQDEDEYDKKTTSSESNTCDSIPNEDEDDFERDYLICRTNRMPKKRMIDTSSDSSSDISIRKSSNPKLNYEETKSNKTLDFNSDLYDTFSDKRTDSTCKVKEKKVQMCVWEAKMRKNRPKM